jgi:hypothetical protein
VRSNPFKRTWYYLCTTLLMLLFRKREVEALGPFGYYCMAVGIVGLLLLLLVTRVSEKWVMKLSEKG